jgi:6-phosphofructokinase 2
LNGGLVLSKVITLTANPAIDIATTVDRVVPLHKLRCTSARRDPGGGGINVARVVRRLGGETTAIYPAGGSTGQLLRRLVDREDVSSIVVAIADETREDFTITEEKSGQQYRFVLPGASLTETEWSNCLNALTDIAECPSFVVGSGSLPPSVPDDFYARAARIAKSRASKMVLDTTGRPLAAALEEGVYLVKPNLRELQELVHVPLSNVEGWLGAAHTLVASGQVEVIALTLGHQGALLVTAESAFRARALDVRAVSAVGAGDSFLGGMVWSLASGGSVIEAFRYGVAAGSAAVMNTGTELCHTADVTRLYNDVQLERLEIP